MEKNVVFGRDFTLKFHRVGCQRLIAVAYDGDCESKAAECVLGTLAAQRIYAESAYFLGSGCLMLKIKRTFVTKALRVLYGAFIERQRKCAEIYR